MCRTKLDNMWPALLPGIETLWCCCGLTECCHCLSTCIFCCNTKQDWTWILKLSPLQVSCAVCHCVCCNASASGFGTSEVCKTARVAFRETVSFILRGLICLPSRSLFRAQVVSSHHLKLSLLLIFRWSTRWNGPWLYASASRLLVFFNVFEVLRLQTFAHQKSLCKAMDLEVFGNRVSLLTQLGSFLSWTHWDKQVLCLFYVVLIIHDFWDSLVFAKALGFASWEFCATTGPKHNSLVPHAKATAAVLTSTPKPGWSQVKVAEARHRFLQLVSRQIVCVRWMQKATASGQPQHTNI